MTISNLLHFTLSRWFCLPAFHSKKKPQDGTLPLTLCCQTYKIFLFPAPLFSLLWSKGCPCLCAKWLWPVFWTPDLQPLENFPYRSDLLIPSSIISGSITEVLVSLRHNWHAIKSCLNCVTWQVLMYVYTCKTITTIKTVNMSTPQKGSSSTS